MALATGGVGDVPPGNGFAEKRRMSRPGEERRVIGTPPQVSPILCAAEPPDDGEVPGVAPPDEILCPCHRSTFDAADGAKVVFGPAARPLPQLPIEVDAEVGQKGGTA